MTAPHRAVELTAEFQNRITQLFGIESSRALVPASEQRPLRGSFEVVALLCYEALHPVLVASRRTSATRALLNPSSDAWLRDPSALSMQLTAYTSFRAIEQRLPLLRISDAGASVALDPFGRRVATLSASTSGGVWVEIPSASTLGLVERAGLVLFPAVVAGLVAVAWVAGLRRMQRARDPRSPELD